MAAVYSNLLKAIIRFKIANFVSPRFKCLPVIILLCLKCLNTHSDRELIDQ